MNLPVVHRIYSSKPSAFLLLLFMLIIPLSARAIPYVYNYMGNTFTSADGDTFTTADSITLHFTWDPSDAITPGWGPLPTPVQVSVGSFAYTSTEGLFAVTEWDMVTLHPLKWNLHLVAPLGDCMIELTTRADGVMIDSVGIWGQQSEVLAIGYNTDAPGTWTMSETAPVPEPATLLLLGSGLLGLVATRKRKRS